MFKSRTSRKLARDSLNERKGLKIPEGMLKALQGV